MLIKTPDRELAFFVKAKNSDNVRKLPLFLLFGFRNNVKAAKGLNKDATGKKNLINIYMEMS